MKSRKIARLSPEERAVRREEIIFDREFTRNAHIKRGRSYLHSTTKVRAHKTDIFGKPYSISQYGYYHHSSARQNARYAGRPDGLMHNLPAGHVVRSNEWKREQMRLAAISAAYNTLDVGAEATGAKSSIKLPKARVTFKGKQIGTTTDSEAEATAATAPPVVKLTGKVAKPARPRTKKAD